jgi:putative Mn2+ efflux pump MntP
MDFFTLFGIALALAMDAFAVALGAGMSLDPLTGRHLFRLGFHFGLFQALMPLIGWGAGRAIRPWIAAYAPWIAFGLLMVVGGRMIREALRRETGETPKADPTRGWSLVLLSIATSLDALAVGLSLAMLGVGIWIPALVIGLVAGLLTVAGMVLGRRLGKVWNRGVEVFGGLVLCAIGLKILIQHLWG